MQKMAFRLIAAGTTLLWSLPATAQPRLDDLSDFSEYVAAFNAADPAFVNFYSPDIIFDKGPEDGVLKGRQAIADWYTTIWQDFAETLTPLTVVIDVHTGIMMVELRTELQARRDGIVWRGRTYRKNDRLIVDGTIVYLLHDGLISSIRGAAEGRQVISAAMMEGES
jgi:ketosteroid isomerase-like protein